jgi:phosphoribosylformimino-5-aminoimidazole carboxamide ribotide isomerase
MVVQALLSIIGISPASSSVMTVVVAQAAKVIPKTPPKNSLPIIQTYRITTPAVHRVIQQSMDVLPAIDLLGGNVVRLSQGRYDAVTVYDDSPARRAAMWRGAVPMLHVVDLEGAKEGRPMQKDAVRSIASAFRGAIQLGGGVRTREAFDAYLALGAARVVLGTAAIRTPELVHALAKEHPNTVVVAVDAKDGWVATDGWTQVSQTSAVDLARSFASSPIAAVLYTDVARDGMRTGPNVDATARLAREAGVSVIASGGVGSVEDLRALAKHPGITHAIVGRALYEGSLTLEDAIRAAS